jgi:hypothetical protein
MNFTTYAFANFGYAGWESRVATAVLGTGQVDMPTFEAPILTPLTVALLVTNGAYYPDQPRMRHHNDLSYRFLPRDLTEVLFAHRTPVRAFALADLNVDYSRKTCPTSSLRT